MTGLLPIVLLGQTFFFKKNNIIKTNMEEKSERCVQRLKQSAEINEYAITWVVKSTVEDDSGVEN